MLFTALLGLLSTLWYGRAYRETAWTSPGSEALVESHALRASGARRCRRMAGTGVARLALPGPSPCGRQASPWLSCSVTDVAVTPGTSHASPVAPSRGVRLYAASHSTLVGRS